MQFASAMDESLYQDGHSYSGEIGMLIGPIDWQDKEFGSWREAEKYLAETQDKFDGPMAVSFVTTEGVKGWIIGGWCSS